MTLCIAGMVLFIVNNNNSRLTGLNVRRQKVKHICVEKFGFLEEEAL